jgi:hypothetical protein
MFGLPIYETHPLLHLTSGDDYKLQFYESRFAERLLLDEDFEIHSNSGSPASNGDDSAYGLFDDLQPCMVVIPPFEECFGTTDSYRAALKKLVREADERICIGGHVVIIARDLRSSMPKGSVLPMGILVVDDLGLEPEETDLKLRDFVACVPNGLVKRIPTSDVEPTQLPFDPLRSLCVEAFEATPVSEFAPSELPIVHNYLFIYEKREKNGINNASIYSAWINTFMRAANAGRVARQSIF